MPEEEQITLSPACPFSSNLPHCTHALRARLSPIFLSRRWHCSSSKRFNASTPSVQHKRASETCTGQSLQTFAVNLAAVGINLILSIRVVVDTVESRHSRKAAGVTRARGHDDGRGKARRLHFGTGSWRGCFCSVQDWTQECSARCAGAGSVGTSVALCEPTPARCRIKLLGRDDKLPTLLQSVCRWRSSRSCVIIPTLTRRH